MANKARNMQDWMTEQQKKAAEAQQRLNTSQTNGALAGIQTFTKGTTGNNNVNTNIPNVSVQVQNPMAALKQVAAQTTTSTPAAEAEKNEPVGRLPERQAQSEYAMGPEAQAYQKQMQLAQEGKPAYQESAQLLQAQEELRNAQGNKPNYAPSESVIAAQAALDNISNNKPQGYTSKYSDQLDAILQQIQNPGQFKYDFNGDELFKMYADQYTQRGKQASLNAMGQAAALTGGYGNSYAQQVAQQAYDQNLTELFDRGMDLRDRAYEQWLNEQNNKYNQYNLLQNADESDYNRYRDTVSDWLNERNYATDRYDTERNFDYSTFRDLMSDWENNRNYYTDIYNNERNIDLNNYRNAVSDWQNNRDYYTDLYNTERNLDYSKWQDARDFAEKQYQFDANMQENIRQFDESLEWDKLSAEQKMAASYVESILAAGHMPSVELLQAAGLSMADAQKLMAQVAPTVNVSVGTSGQKKDTKNSTDKVTGNEDGKVYYSDMGGAYYEKQADGTYKKVPSSQVKDTDYVDSSNAAGISMKNLGAITFNAAANEAAKKKKGG